MLIAAPRAATSRCRRGRTSARPSDTDSLEAACGSRGATEENRAMSQRSNIPMSHQKTSRCRGGRQLTGKVPRRRTHLWRRYDPAVQTCCKFATPSNGPVANVRPRRSFGRCAGDFFERATSSKQFGAPRGRPLRRSKGLPHDHDDGDGDGDDDE